MSLITQFMEKSLMISWNFVSRWAACYAMVLGSKPKPCVATYHIILKQLGDVNDFLYSNDRWNFSVLLQIVTTAKNGPIQLKCVRSLQCVDSRRRKGMGSLFRSDVNFASIQIMWAMLIWMQQGATADHIGNDGYNQEMDAVWFRISFVLTVLG